MHLLAVRFLPLRSKFCPALKGAVLAALGVISTSSLGADTPTELRVDFAHPAGRIRPLHGINKGPISAGGLIDITAALRDLHLPFARLHDCHWPNPDVVDIHAVFPDFDADAELPSSYDFRLTDEYIAATRAIGAEIIYRLGESIEHTSIKRFVHPPRNFEKWASICRGIIRHYNEGWADGFYYRIRYLEIWNEPENRPAMWSGSDEDYFRLYRVAAIDIKKRYPNLKIGGPALGYTGVFENGAFRPGAFATNFLSFCQRESLPLDFFSWHCYSAEPSEPAARARALRRLLDDYGFTATESHLNEWNFLPGNNWNPLSPSGSPEARQRSYEEISGAAGGAFIATALQELEDAPVDVCNLFHGELGGFGLFNEYGVACKNYQALLAFSALSGASDRREARGGISGKLAVTASMAGNHQTAAILLSNFAASETMFRLVLMNLPWRGGTLLEIRRITPTESFDSVSRQTNNATSFDFEFLLTKPAVALIQLTPVERIK
jgi:xylan 1,4-beta-xylosidase